MDGLDSCAFLKLLPIKYYGTILINVRSQPAPDAAPHGCEPINDIAVIASQWVIGLNTHLLSIKRLYW